MKETRNILIISTDQQRWDSLPCYGLDFVRAPNIERLAERGVVFDNCFVSAPICVASRVSFLTGLHPSAHGAVGNSYWPEEGTWMWPGELSESGMKTAAIGKMHFYPWDADGGFSERIAAEDKRHYYRRDDYTAFLEKNGHKRLHAQETPGYYENLGAMVSDLPQEFHIDSFTGDQAAEWMEKNADQGPFAAWVSFPGPHDPYDPPAEYAELYEEVALPEPIGSRRELENKPACQKNSYRSRIKNPLFNVDYRRAGPEDIRRMRAYYYANITLIDHRIGKILEVLEKKGIFDDTLVIFTSDHGDALGDHGLFAKGFFYESMIRVPLIICGPQVPSGTRSSALIQQFDILPLIFKACGNKLTQKIQARDMSHLFTDPQSVHREHVFCEMKDRFMVRTGNYKYAYYISGEEELYDLRREPLEVKNLADDIGYKEEKEKLRKLLLDHLIDTNVYMAEMRRTPPDPERMAYFENLTLKSSISCPERGNDR